MEATWDSSFDRFIRGTAPDPRTTAPQHDLEIEATATGLLIQVRDATGRVIASQRLSAEDSLALAGEILDRHRDEVKELIRISPTAVHDFTPAEPLGDRWALLEMAEAMSA